MNAQTPEALRKDARELKNALRRKKTLIIASATATTVAVAGVAYKVLKSQKTVENSETPDETPESDD